MTLVSGSAVSDAPSQAPARRPHEPAAVPGPTTPRPTVTAHRARPTAIATLALMLGLAGAFLVATGALAAIGVGFGLLALLAGIAGLARSSRPFTTGRGDAVIGLLLGLAAIVVGVMAITGHLAWLDPATNQVTRLHDWLDARLPWLTAKHPVG